MATARALVLAASLAAVSAEAAGFHYGFSDCVDNKRTLFYYTDEGGTCSQATDGQELAKRTSAISSLWSSVPFGS